MKMALSSQLQGKEWQQPENLAEARDRPPPGPEGARPGRHLALGPERRPLDSRPPELREKRCARLKPPSVWRFVSHLQEADGCLGTSGSSPPSWPCVRKGQRHSSAGQALCARWTQEASPEGPSASARPKVSSRIITRIKGVGDHKALPRASGTK